MTNQIPVTTQVDVSAPIEHVFDAIVPIDLTKIFRGMGPLPAVVAVHDQTSAWDRVGASRRVELSDKSTAHEQLTGYERPNHFSYRLDEFTGPLALLVSHVEGSWRFSAGPSATHVGWTYAFHPRRGRALIIRRLVAPVWRRYQQRVMNLAADEAAVVLS